MKLPFSEIKLNNNEFIREFSINTDSGELTWHRDRESRIVKSIEETDWMVQLEDQLPESLNNDVFIPMGVWHRLLKGTGDLKIKMIKLN